MLRLAAITLPLLLTGVAGAQTPGFRLVGHAPGTSSSVVLCLSQDGSVAGGHSASGSLLSPGFTYTASGGRFDWGLEPRLPPTTSTNALSSTGAVMAGQMYGLQQPLRAFRRIGAGPLENLGVLPGEERSFASGTSGDGTVVVGTTEHSPSFNAYGQAFRWTASGGMQGLGYLRPNGVYSRANGISRDGGTIVGLSDDGPFGTEEAYRWTAGTGMQALPNLPGALVIESSANAVNLDGTIIVGTAKSATAGAYTHAVRWVNGEVEDLGVLGAYLTSYAYAVSDDGSVVAGSAAGWVAFVWSPSTGMISLTDHLQSYGITPPAGYRLERVNAVSGDGRTFGGLAINLATNAPEGFVATIPAPGGGIALLGGAAWASRRRRAAGIE